MNTEKIYKQLLKLHNRCTYCEHYNSDEDPFSDECSNCSFPKSQEWLVYHNSKPFTKVSNEEEAKDIVLFYSDFFGGKWNYE